MQELITENNQVAIINESIELFRKAPDVLQKNQNRSASAIRVGNEIISQWQQAWAIETETERMAALTAADERSNKFLSNCAIALKDEKEARSVITQMIDEFKKLFTAAENEIDKAKADTVPNKVQKNRDEFAKESYRIQEQKRKEAEWAAAKAKEEIQIRASENIRLFNDFNNWLLEKKTKMSNFFNALTLDTFNEGAEKIKTSTIVISWQPQPANVESIYHTVSEKEVICGNEYSGIITDIKSNAVAELTLLRDDLIQKLPSKRGELIEQKRLADEAVESKRKADDAAKNAKNEVEKQAAEQARIAAEQARIAAEQAAAEQKKREKEESRRMVDEAAEAKRKAEQEAEIKKQGEQTMVMFEQEAAIANTDSAPEARQGYEITILHPVGYTQIFAIWFENEGKNLPVDKIGNTKLDQMKAWAEKHAHKTGTKIESKFLKYEGSFKAINRKLNN